MRAPPPRITNLALLVALGVAFASGVGAVAAGTVSGRWVAVGHGVVGVAVVLLVPWKSMIVRRGLRRPRRSRWVSLLLAALAVAALGTGLGSASGLGRSVGGLYGIWLHVAAALALVPLVVWHVLARPAHPHRTDLSRRALLRSRWPPSTRETVGMRPRRPRPAPMPRSAFAGFRFPPDVIVLAVRWYLRFGLSYRDVEELLTERGVEVDHVTVYRWVLRFTPLLADAAKPCRHTVGDRWYVDETYVKVAGRWRYVYRAIDQFGQVIDVFVSARRDADAAHRFFERAIGTTKVAPVEVVTDRAPTYPQVLDELLPAAWHRTDRYANNRVEADHGRLKARLRPMRGLKQDRSARVIAAGHAFVQNVRRGHYELAVDEPATRRLVVALAGLALAI
jgi:transposase-like protein